MTMSIRKLLVLGVIGGIFLLGNILFVAHWLSEVGAVDLANDIREKFLTGTAITVIVALLILLVGPKGSTRRFLSSRHCPVCDHGVNGSAKYCEECGSKI